MYARTVNQEITNYMDRVFIVILGLILALALLRVQHAHLGVILLGGPARVQQLVQMELVELIILLLAYVPLHADLGLILTWDTVTGVMLGLMLNLVPLHVQYA